MLIDVSLRNRPSQFPFINFIISSRPVFLSTPFSTPPSPPLVSPLRPFSFIAKSPHPSRHPSQTPLTPQKPISRARYPKAVAETGALPTFMQCRQLFVGFWENYGFFK